MGGLLERISAARGETRFNIDPWITDFLAPAYNQWGSNPYYGLNQTFPGHRVSEIVNTLPAYAAALQRCPPAFAAQMVRALVLSQAKFTFRNFSWWRTNPGKVRGTGALALLEEPWPNGTTGQMVSQMEWHAGLAGNAYVTNRTAGRLRVLRPDWVAILYGSHQEPEDAAYALDGELIGYVYANGGLVPPNGGGDITGMFRRAETLLPDEVAHYTAAGMADPLGAGIGMSWLTPAIRDIQLDEAATAHKIAFFKNNATPNMVVKGIPAQTNAQFEALVDLMEARHAGVANAFKTWYLTAGADATVVGSNFRDSDLKAIQGATETRISYLSRVPAPILGISEGLQGSSLNAGNFSSARRTFADTWVYPTLSDYAASLAPLVRVPAGAQLWFDASDMAILRDDSKDAAEITQVQASTIVSLVSTGGYTRESAVAAVTTGDMTSLVLDPDWTSVQLQKTNKAAAPPQSNAPAPPGGTQPAGF